MSTFKTILTSAALVVMAGSVNAATLKFEIKAEVSYITGNVEADVTNGDMVSVSGQFNTDSLRNSVFDNRLRYMDVSNVAIDGPVFGDHDEFTVSLLEVRDDEAGIESDLFRLIIDFQNGPSVNDYDYGRVRLSFYIPMAATTLDAATFMDLENKIYPDLLPAADGRTAVMNGAFRFPVQEDARNAGFRGDVSSISIAPIPLPASGLLLLTVLGGMGYAGKRRKSA